MTDDRIKLEYRMWEKPQYGMTHSPGSLRRLKHHKFGINGRQRTDTGATSLAGEMPALKVLNDEN